MKQRGFLPHTPLLIICGHYGVGKTNFALNVLLEGRSRGLDTTLIDLDVVNPYFRSSDYEVNLTSQGIHVVAPALAGTTLDGPSLSGAIEPSIERAHRVDNATSTPSLVVVDVGGDDVGATVLGRYSHSVLAGPYEMLYVVNRSRNLTQTPVEAVSVLREIEQNAHIKGTAVLNNTNLKQDTDISVIEAGIPFAQEVANQAHLPLVGTTLPKELAVAFLEKITYASHPLVRASEVYPIDVFVKTPWE